MKFTVENEHIQGTLGFDEIHISPDEKHGYRPFELFISSLIGCSGTLLKNILIKKRYPFTSIEMKPTARRNPEQANRIEQITIIASIQTGQEITSDQAEKLAQLVVKNCGMIQSVISTIDVDFQIESVPEKR
ncbi:hypothetical protein GCM10008967_20340 [Bacillus carboniphilus]|uniref:Osmotically inducible protein C n=1 Tax=Bacillus carboniphilus TaxID=86663 RepID=A0ABN0W9G8_9BACI